MKTKSAKDLAFDRERDKFRHQINELNKQLGEKEFVNHILKTEVTDLRNEISDLKKEIDILKSCCNMTEDDLKLLLEEKKSMKTVSDTLSIVGKITGPYGGFY